MSSSVSFFTKKRVTIIFITTFSILLISSLFNRDMCVNSLGSESSWSSSCVQQNWSLEEICNSQKWTIREKPIKIYDAFPFASELLILEARLFELYPVIDKFFIIESVYSHRGKEKKLYFNDNKERFSTYMDKIVHIVLNDSNWVYDQNYKNDETYSFRRQQMQAEALYRELVAHGVTKEDWVFYASTDEIPKRSTIEAFKYCKGYPDRVGVSITDYLYNFHCYDTKPVPKLKFWKFDQFKESCEPLTNNLFGILFHYFKTWVDYPRYPLCLDDARTFKNSLQILDAGWHLSFFANVSENIKKMGRMAHSSRDTPENRAKMEYWMKNCIHTSGKQMIRTEEYIEKLPLGYELLKDFL